MEINNLAISLLTISSLTWTAATTGVSDRLLNNDNAVVVQSSSSSEKTEVGGSVTLPKRLTMSVIVSQPEDLIIVKGQELKKGQVIADRRDIKERLEKKKKELKASLVKVKSAIITPPIAPTQTSVIASLPPISFFEQEATVEKAKAQVNSAGSDLRLKQEEINYLETLENLDPIVLEHERVKLNQLQQKHTASIRNYQVASGKLASKKNDRKYQEYLAGINQVQRIEERNKAQLTYQHQVAEYEQKLIDKEFRVNQLQEEINNVQSEIDSLSIKAPFAGTIRRINWLGQSSEGKLTAQVTLIVSRETAREQRREERRVNKTEASLSQ